MLVMHLQARDRRLVPAVVRAVAAVEGERLVKRGGGTEVVCDSAASLMHNGFNSFEEDAALKPSARGVHDEKTMCRLLIHKT